MAEQVKVDRFTNGKRRIMSETEFNARWGSSGGGKNFCALCNRTFQIGDGWRWVYANGPKPEGVHSFGNFSVCDPCDGPDVLDRYQAACNVIYASIHGHGEGHWPIDVADKLLTCIKALQAYEELDDKHANCPECEGMAQPELCAKCFPYADSARLQMRAILEDMK